MGFRGGGVKLPPPSISWFSSTPAEIGLTMRKFFAMQIFAKINFFVVNLGNFI